MEQIYEINTGVLTMEHDYSWVYLLIFLAIPLARIIPRVLSRMKAKQQVERPEPQMDQSGPEQVGWRPQEVKPEPRKKPDENTPEKRVLGAMNRGAKTFEGIQRGVEMDEAQLQSILGAMEEKGLMKVIRKRGMLGEKVELHPTSKGFEAYYF